MNTILPFLFRYSRLFFALLFLAPLFAQIMVRTGMTQPLGLQPLVLGFILAGLFGLQAQIRGRWL